MRNIPLLVAVLLIGVLATLGILIATGVMSLPGSNGRSNGNGFVEPIRIGPGGNLEAVLAPGGIPAYTKITREHLINPRTGTFDIFESGELPPGTLASPSQLLGRVLMVDKSPGYLFNESEFLPEGTRGGVTAGVPPGKRAVVIEAGRIQGAYALNMGDRIDLVSMAPLSEASATVEDGRLVVSPATVRNRVNDSRRVPVVLATNAEIIRPVTRRTEFFEQRSGALGAQMDIRQKPIEEITLAVDPDEAAGLLGALSNGTRIVALARSGRVNDVDVPIVFPMPVIEHEDTAAAEVVEPEVIPDPPVVIEAIVGSRRNDVVFE